MRLSIEDARTVVGLGNYLLLDFPEHDDGNCDEKTGFH